jgi:hypothetical protein
MELRYAGSSEMIMLKLEKNRKLLKQSRKKSSVKKEGSSLMVGMSNEKAEDDFLGLVTYSLFALSSLCARRNAFINSFNPPSRTP